MKENELIGMKNKIASLTNIVQYLLQENQNIKTLASGTFETIRFMPDYDEAVAKLAEKVKESAEARPENVEVVDEEIVTPKLEID
jgi:predicted methyltransferase